MSHFNLELMNCWQPALDSTRHWTEAILLGSLASTGILTGKPALCPSALVSRHVILPLIHLFAHLDRRPLKLFLPWSGPELWIPWSETSSGYQVSPFFAICFSQVCHLPQKGFVFHLRTVLILLLLCFYLLFPRFKPHQMFSFDSLKESYMQRLCLLPLVLSE